MILPPPNITGNLHLGHALTITLQDIIARWLVRKQSLNDNKKMCGCVVFYFVSPRKNVYYKLKKNY